MDATRDIYQQLAARAGHSFLDALRALPEFKPRPGVTLGLLRVSVTVVDGPDLGSVDMDPINLGDLAQITARRAEGLRLKHDPTTPAPAPFGKANLHLVGGA
jgi:hypothetical protein